MKRLLFICLLSCLLPVTAAHAGVVAEIDFTTTTDGGTGEALDMGTNINMLPLTVAVSEVPGLNLTIQAATTNVMMGATEINGTNAGFGINSPGGAAVNETANAFDGDFGESITFSFDQEVKITEIDFSGFDTGEAVNFGDLFIPFADVGAGDVLTFDSDLIIAANTNILLSPAGSSSLGLQSITVHVDVPEPGSLVMLGFGSVLMIARRRRR